MEINENWYLVDFNWTWKNSWKKNALQTDGILRKIQDGGQLGGHLGWRKGLSNVTTYNVYKGFSLSFVFTIVTLILIATFRPLTAGLHQVIVSICWVGLFVPPWLFVIGVLRTPLMAGGSRSKALLVVSEEKTDPSAIRCGSDRLLCYLVWL